MKIDTFQAFIKFFLLYGGISINAITEASESSLGMQQYPGTARIYTIYRTLSDRLGARVYATWHR